MLWSNPQERRNLALLLSIVAHAGAVLIIGVASVLSVPVDGDEVRDYDLTEFEIPEPEPEPEPETEPPPPPPKPIAKPKNNPPPTDEPPNDEPPPPFRLDMSNLVEDGNSGVAVQVGEPGGVPGGTGKPGSKGTGSAKPGGPPKGEPGGTGDVWSPKSELAIKSLPTPVKVPVIECPAVQELGVEGTVVLAVQVRSDGTVRSVKVTKGMGYGCDKVAQQALRKAKFKPAIATDGKAADYELRYEYEFQLDE